VATTRTEQAEQLRQRAIDLRLRDLKMVANKVTSDEDTTFIKEQLPELPLLGVIPYHDAFAEADRRGCAPLESVPPEIVAEFESILNQIEKGDAA
jgi:CO dehydrogenase nickel-insertion accessory protein CooC1